MTQIKETICQLITNRVAQTLNILAILCVLISFIKELAYQELVAQIFLLAAIKKCLLGTQ